MQNTPSILFLSAINQHVDSDYEITTSRAAKREINTYCRDNEELVTYDQLVPLNFHVNVTKPPDLFNLSLPNVTRQALTHCNNAKWYMSNDTQEFLAANLHPNLTVNETRKKLMCYLEIITTEMLLS